MMHQRIIRGLLLSLLALHLIATPAGAAQNLKLPDIGESSESFMSLEDEQRLGDAFMRNLRTQLDIINDPLLNDYINRLGQRLVAASDNHGRHFSFFVVDAGDINAFAGPGGYIGINSGLILVAESEGELAGVMAHEIAHITQRHIARAFQEASRLNLPLTAAVIAAIILGRDNAQVAEAAIAASAAGSIQHQINFTRSNEKEADRAGLRILAQSGIDPRDMPRFFERLQRAALLYDSQPIEFLRTHPVTHSRIADTLSRAEQYPPVEAPDDTTFRLMQARTRILTSHTLKQEQQYFADMLRRQPEREPVARYGLALTALHLGELDLAERHIAVLRRSDPLSLPYGLLEAELARDQGDLPAALAVYARLADSHPRSTALAIHHAETLINDKRYLQAQQLLEQHLRSFDSPPYLYKLLAEARNGLGAVAAAHEALAEFYYQSGDLGTALRHLQTALEKSDDAQLRARLRERIAQLQQERREDDEAR